MNDSITVTMSREDLHSLMEYLRWCAERHRDDGELEESATVYRYVDAFEAQTGIG